jgi:hypothetical protein
MADSLSILQSLARGGGAGIKTTAGAPKISNSFARQLAGVTDAKTPDIKITGGSGAASKAHDSGGFWHIVGDILDRPRRAVGDFITEGAVQGIKTQGKRDTELAHGDVLGALGTTLGGVGQALAAGGRGLVSNDKKDHRSSSEDIERVVDTFGKTNDPHYKNTKDNVNPLLKGIAGFAGDVVTDPLTYVPLPVGKGLGALSKLFGKGSEGVKAAEIAAEAAPRAGRTAPVFEAGGDEVPGIQKISRGLAIEAPKITVVASRPGAALPKPSIFEPAASAEQIANRAVEDIKPIAGKITDSKVVATDPVLKPPVESFIEKLSKPDLDVLEHSTLKALPDVLKDQFSKKKYDFALKSGAVATSTDGKGFAKFSSHLGTFAGWNTLKAISRPFQKAIDEAPKGERLFGMRRADVLWDKVMVSQKLAEGLVDSYGGVFHIDYKGERIPVSPTQVFQLIHDASPDSAKAIKLALFNHSTAVAPTKILEAAVLSAKGATDAEIAAHLVSAAKGHVREGVIGDAQHFLGKPLGTKAKVAHLGNVANEEVLAGLLDGVGAGASAKILALAERNSAEYQMRFQGEYLQMSDEIKANLSALSSDPEKVGAFLAAVNHPDVAAKDIAERAHTLPESAVAATEQVVEDTAAAHPGVIENAKSAVAVEAAVKRGDDTSKAARIASDSGAKVADDASAAAERAGVPEALELASEDTVNVATGLSTKAYRETQGGFMAFADPLVKGVNEGRGLEGTGLFHLYNSFGSAKRAIGDAHRAAISLMARDSVKIDGKHTTLAEGFSTYLRSAESSSPEVATMRNEVAAFMGQFFPVGGGPASMGSIFHRIGWSDVEGLEHLNARAGSGHYPALKPLQFDVQAARTVAAAEGITPLEAAIRQLPDLLDGVDDIPQFMSSLSVMGLRAANEAAVVHGAEQRLIEMGLALRGPRTGMARAVFEKSSPLQAFASKDLRVDPKAAGALQSLHTMLTPKGPIGGPWGTFLREVYDPIQNGWKFGVTLIRPGHHVRNAIGNISMNFMAEGGRFAAQSTRDMAKIIAAHGSYQDVDAVKFLTSFGEIGYKGAGERMFTVKMGQKAVHLTNEDVYAGLKNNGVFATVKDIEGFGDIAAHSADEAAEEGSGVLSRAIVKGTRQSGLAKVAGKLSEFNDHTSKAQQAAQILRKYEKDGYITAAWGQKIRPQSTKELFEVIGARVRMYHPDGQTLTEFERRVVRRVIPFYTWLRGALPALVETSLMNPGRATVFMKASYNLAVSSGVNPDSISNPFPPDQLFPSFLANDPVGPQLKIGGAYFSVAPGISSLDMAHTFQNPLDPKNTAQSVLGMVSPILRTPIELASGTQLATGAPIKDFSDYVDQQIPGISTIPALTGLSVSGSVAGLATGQGLDQTRNARSGLKDQNPYKGLASLLTGATVTNTSQDNYIKAAEYEQKDKAKPLESGQATSF